MRLGPLRFGGADEGFGVDFFAEEVCLESVEGRDSLLLRDYENKTLEVFFLLDVQTLCLTEAGDCLVLVIFF